MPSCSKEAMLVSGSSAMLRSEWKDCKRNGWWVAIVKSKECEGNASAWSWINGKMSVSEMNGFDWCILQAAANLWWNWLWRILLIHSCRNHLEMIFGVRYWAVVPGAVSDARAKINEVFGQERSPSWEVLIKRWWLRYPWTDDVHDSWCKWGRVFRCKCTDEGTIW